MRISAWIEWPAVVPNNNPGSGHGRHGTAGQLHVPGSLRSGAVVIPAWLALGTSPTTTPGQDSTPQQRKYPPRWTPLPS